MGNPGVVKCLLLAVCLLRAPSLQKSGLRDWAVGDMKEASTGRRCQEAGKMCTSHVFRLMLSEARRSGMCLGKTEEGACEEEIWHGCVPIPYYI